MSKALKCNFTYYMGEEQEAENSTSQKPVYLPRERIESNLVTFCSNVLKVYALEESSINLRLTTQFNDKILDVIKVPTKQFLKEPVEQQNSKKSTPQQPSTGRAARASRRNVDIE